MKKIIIMFVAVLATLIVSTGCKSVSTSDGATQIPQPESKFSGYEAQFEHKNVRVSGEGEVNVLFGIFAWGSEGFAENSTLSSFSFLPSPANFAKSSAVYDACQSNNADVLVGTRYKVTTMDYFVFKVVKCEVSGYPAIMTDVKKLKPYALGNNIFYLSEKPEVIK